MQRAGAEMFNVAMLTPVEEQIKAAAQPQLQQQETTAPQNWATNYGGQY
jgi:hypothetical protein